MKKTFLTWAMTLLAVLSPAFAWAVAAPTGIAASPWANSGSYLSWTDDPTATQWYIYLEGNLLFSPQRSYVSTSGTGRVGFQLTGISQASLPRMATMKAIAGGAVSVMSAGVTITAVGPVPFTYVVPAPGAVFSTTASGTGGGTSAVSVTADSSAASAARNASLASIDAKASLAATEATLSAMAARIAVMEGHLTSTAKGTLADPVLSDATVVGGSIGVTKSGTWIIDGVSGTISLPTGASTATNQATANTALGSISTSSAATYGALSSTGAAAQQVQGNVANDSPDAGNPFKVGGVGRTTLPTAVTDGDRVDAQFDKMGRQVITYSLRERRAQGNATLSTTTETTVITAGASGVFRDLVFLLISNGGNNKNRIAIRDSVAGAVIFYVNMASSGGGAVAPLLIRLPQTTAANAWTVQLDSVPGGGGVVDVFMVALEDR